MIALSPFNTINNSPLHAQKTMFQFPPHPQSMANVAKAVSMMSVPPVLGATINLNNNPYGRTFVSRSPESLKTPVVPFPKDL